LGILDSMAQEKGREPVAVRAGGVRSALMVVVGC
jgi:hypothetical protein